ncbi:hypothetical protein FKP32DRAFT_608094 [Trametes sanguinea]|nr:hypothetical protein FKP32DRAFT_608094 [Trametes sanguinea]
MHTEHQVKDLENLHRSMTRIQNPPRTHADRDGDGPDRNLSMTRHVSSSSAGNPDRGTALPQTGVFPFVGAMMWRPRGRGKGTKVQYRRAAHCADCAGSSRGSVTVQANKATRLSCLDRTCLLIPRLARVIVRLAVSVAPLRLRPATHDRAGYSTGLPLKSQRWTSPLALARAS